MPKETFTYNTVNEIPPVEGSPIGPITANFGEISTLNNTNIETSTPAEESKTETKTETLHAVESTPEDSETKTESTGELTAAKAETPTETPAVEKGSLISRGHERMASLGNLFTQGKEKVTGLLSKGKKTLGNIFRKSGKFLKDATATVLSADVIASRAKSTVTEAIGRGKDALKEKTTSAISAGRESLVAGYDSLREKGAGILDKARNKSTTIRISFLKALHSRSLSGLMDRYARDKVAEEKATERREVSEKLMLAKLELIKSLDRVQTKKEAPAEEITLAMAPAY